MENSSFSFIPLQRRILGKDVDLETDEVVGMPWFNDILHDTFFFLMGEFIPDPYPSIYLFKQFPQ